jgi:hypothetical protein
VHNVAAIASGIARSGADIIAIDGFRAGRERPLKDKGQCGYTIELALAAVDERLREEGIRDSVSLVVGGSIRNSADIYKGYSTGRRRGLYSYKRAYSAGLPPLQNLPSGKMQLGNSNAKGRAC